MRGRGSRGHSLCGRDQLGASWVSPFTHGHPLSGPMCGLWRRVSVGWVVSEHSRGWAGEMARWLWGRSRISGSFPWGLGRLGAH